MPSPNPTHSTFTIGTLALRTGVPVKTIRYYSDQGLLPPAKTDETGYRRYTETDLARLETIRTLRGAGFSLKTIRALLDRELDLISATRLQLQTLRAQERTIRRQRTLLERALDFGDLTGYQERLHALALLSARERESFLRQHLERGMDDLPIDPVWRHGFLDDAVADLPDDLSDAQLDAWMEAATMVADPTFAEAITRIARPFWEEVDRTRTWDGESYQEHNKRIHARAKAALRQGSSPDSGIAQEIVREWLQDMATILGRPHDTAFAEWTLEQRRAHDPRLARYWDLIAVIKGWSVDPDNNRAWSWLFDALAAQVGCVRRVQ